MITNKNKPVSLFTKTSKKNKIVAEILKLKKKKNAIILSHFYQPKEIQDIADFIGDSLALSLKASNTNHSIILFAGVFFMAETAKILCPQKKVLLPDLLAGCSLADSCEYEKFKEFKLANPNHLVITYINCSAAIKTLSDIVCTSSNAMTIINSLPIDQSIIFAPDKNLGKYLQKETGRKLLLWDGACVVHEAFSLEKIISLKRKYPKAEIVAHPESEDEILAISHFVGSTSAMINYSKTSSAQTLIIATEEGLLHQMQKEIPHKTLIPAPSKQNNTCACSECGAMKLNTLEKVLDALKTESPEILLEESIIKKAIIPLKKMIELSL